MPIVKDVLVPSYADECGIRIGDVVDMINGHRIRDVLDYRFYLTERRVEISLLRGADTVTVNIEKDEYDDIGLVFETPLMDEKHSCKNGCIFCFIDQNPEGLRDTLYFKDDDSRLSFIHGNYITLTNLTDEDAERIVKMRFSPLNISIHTTDPELRVRMMKNKRSGEVLRYLDVFADAGLDMCGQIVLCRGVNDGEALRRTMSDLSRLYPRLTSVAIVPAGLTKFRDRLYSLTDFSAEEALDVINTVDAFAEDHRRRTGSRLFFVADEFYLKAGLPIPDADYYEDYPQIENGVGLIRSLDDELTDALSDVPELSAALPEPRRVALATGTAAYPMMCRLRDAIALMADNIKIDVYEIKNEFFGESITVAGLLTGRDILSQLSGRLDADELIIPAAALRRDECDFLCGMTLSELEEGLDIPIRPAENDGFDLIDAIFGVEV